MKEKWMVAARKADFNAIGKACGVSPILARLAVNRGMRTIGEVHKYLYGGLEDLHDPRQMKDLEKAADILLEQLDQGEKICIAADFDADGIFSGYSLWKAIRRLGGSAYVVTPDRIREGYGLNENMTVEAYKNGAGCILTCDNGIAALEAVESAKRLGLTVVVTDHHEPIYEEDASGTRHYRFPAADAVVDPKQPDCMYPFKGLCGAGVAYKLIQILFERRHIPEKELYDLLPYTAIATVADVMDLTDENRILVKYGLYRLRQTDNMGLKAMLRRCNLEDKYITANHIAFILGPCFNAAGRLTSTQMALQLLMTDDAEEAAQLAADLAALNDSRKEMTAIGYEQAAEKIETERLYEQPVMMMTLEDCHESLAGIIAGRIKERYHRPVIVCVPVENGLMKGSGRSIETYNMYDGLNACREYLERFGGHAAAAGITFRRGYFDKIRQRLIRQCGLGEADFTPVVHIDIAMPIRCVTESLIQELDFLEPMGKGNESPLFAEKNLRLTKGVILGKNRNALKMKATGEGGISLDALYFGDIEAFEECIREHFGQEALNGFYDGKDDNIRLSMTYYPSINEFRGVRTLQIIIQNYMYTPA